MKSIILSILAIVISAALLFVVAYMFAYNIILGIAGVIFWGMINATLLSKAADAATGFFDRLLAKYVVPIIGAILMTGLILCVIIPGALTSDGLFWFFK